MIAVLAATRDGASINAAANASGINFRTSQRIVQGADKHRQRELAAVGQLVMAPDGRTPI